MINSSTSNHYNSKNNIHDTNTDRNAVTGVILAGGQSKRMGGEDKGLLSLAGEWMINYSIRAMKAQVNHLIINANRNMDLYAQLGYPIITDSTHEFLGPLAGMLAALHHAETEYILTMPCDSPLLASDYCQRMLAAAKKDESKLCVASDGLRLQPVFVLLHTSLHSNLNRYLDQDERKIDRWLNQHQTTVVNFADHRSMFKNINTPEDLKALEEELNQSS